MIKPGLYAVDGQFGSGKTLLMARWIVKALLDKKTIVFTNIKMTFIHKRLYNYTETFYKKEYDEQKKKVIEKKYFGLADVLKFIGEMDDEQRKRKIPRDMRLRYMIFDDEAGIIFNQHNWKYFDLTMYDYLLQVRKINVSIFLAAQKYKNISKQLREHIDSVFYWRPFMNIPFFTNFGEVRQKYVDDEGNIEMQKDPVKDENGNWTYSEKPLDFFREYIYKKSWRKYYDDLYLNKKFAESGYHLDYSNLKDDIMGFFNAITVKSLKNNRRSWFLPFKKEKKKNVIVDGDLVKNTWRTRKIKTPV